MKPIAVQTLYLGADNMFGRKIHQVPVIDKPGIFKVGPADLLLLGGFLASIGLNHYQQGQEPGLMDGGSEQFDGQGKGIVFLGQPSDLRNAETDEYIILSVFTRSGFETFADSAPGLDLPNPAIF